MTDRRKPPPSIWAGVIEGLNAEAVGKTVAGTNAPIKHTGEAHPWTWEVLLAALDLLRGTAGPEAAQSARMLDAILGQAGASEELAGALVTYQLRASDPVAARRRKLGDERRIAPAVRIRNARRRLLKMQDDLFARTERDPIPLGDDLRLAAMDIEGNDGAPRPEDVGAAIRAASDALLHLDRVAAQMERAAPPPKARPHSVEVRARTKMFETMCRAYVAAGGWGPDDAFWDMAGAVWEAYTREKKIPGLRDLKKKVSEKF